MYKTQLAVYKKVQKASMSGRELEASVLTQAALKLKECQENWMNLDYSKLNDALKYNQKLWSIFQSELADESNPLPLNLKQDILSLSIFIDKRIFEIMAYPEPEKLTVLININLNIAAGLRRVPLSA
jgi:flagellar biosynthesis activator protein FlaF